MSASSHYLNQSVRIKHELLVNLPVFLPSPTLCYQGLYLTWLLVLCRHTRLLHISQSLSKPETPRRWTSCVSWEKTGAQERKELATKSMHFCYFCFPAVSKQAIKSAGKGKGVDVDYYDLLVSSLFCSWKDNTEKEEGKDKCQSVETCLGISGRRVETEWERARRPGEELKHKYFPTFP